MSSITLFFSFSNLFYSGYTPEYLLFLTEIKILCFFLYQTTSKKVEFYSTSAYREYFVIIRCASFPSLQLYVDSY